MVVAIKVKATITSMEAVVEKMAIGKLTRGREVTWSVAIEKIKEGIPVRQRNQKKTNH
jgi:hypothetical protein